MKTVRRRRLSSAGREEGSGTVLAAGLAIVVVLLLSGVLLLVQATVAAARAGTAADLAALSAADAARGLIAGEPCVLARLVAAENEALLSTCRITGSEIADVVTVVQLPAPLGEATGRSRAGPPPE